MNILKMLNPINWIKGAVVSAIEKEIDRVVTREWIEPRVQDAANRLIAMSEAKVDDAEMRKRADELIYAGTSLVEFGNAIHPDGEGGRRLTVDEIATIRARVQVLFGDVLPAGLLDDWRECIKAWVRSKIEV